MTTPTEKRLRELAEFALLGSSCQQALFDKTANPQTVLALLDRIERLGSENQKLHAQLDERNQATKVWIQSDTQSRARYNRVLQNERAMGREEGLEAAANSAFESFGTCGECASNIGHGIRALAANER